MIELVVDRGLDDYKFIWAGSVVLCKAESGYFGELALAV